MRTFFLLAVTASLGACVFKGPHVPSDLKGDIPVVIANRGPSPVCALIIQPFDEPQARSDNWLGTGYKQEKIGAGKDREFRIKPGSYRVGVGACDNTWAAGTQQGKLDIQQATFVAIGNRAEAPPEYQLAFLPAQAVQQPTYAEGGGDEAPAEEAPAETGSESSSSSSESAAAPSAPTVPNPGGKPSGAFCENSYECASNACVTHSPDNYCR